MANVKIKNTKGKIFQPIIIEIKCETVEEVKELYSRMAPYVQHMPEASAKESKTTNNTIGESFPFYRVLRIIKEQK